MINTAIRPKGLLHRAAQQSLLLSLPGGAVITKPFVRFFARNARVQYQHSRNAKPCVPAVFIITHRRRKH